MALVSGERKPFNRVPVSEAGSGIGSAASGLRRRPIEGAGLVVAVLMVVLAIVGPWLAPHNPDAVMFSSALRPPGLSHWFGTDAEGRDVLSRVLYGIRLTLVGVAVVISVAMVIGTTVGTLAALAGGIVDDVLMRIVDIGLSFPPIILALGIAAALGAGFQTAIIAVAISWWPGYARLVRTLVIEVKGRPFVQAARVLGVPGPRILLRHILLNALDLMFVQMTVDVAAVALTIAGLSFVGVGAQPPTPELGAMIATGSGQLLTAWWGVVFPGVVLVIIAVSFGLTGDLLQRQVRGLALVTAGDRP